jgi:hypothetical protein
MGGWKDEKDIERMREKSESRHHPNRTDSWGYVPFYHILPSGNLT